MHQRHLINYVPGRGYVELQSPGVAEELQEALCGNVLADQASALADDYLQLEMRAYLRLRFALQMLLDRQQGRRIQDTPRRPQSAAANGSNTSSVPSIFRRIWKWC
jgi:hypothetical protein